MNENIKAPGPIKSVELSDLGEACAGLLNEITRTGERAIITRQGEPVADLVPRQSREQNARGIWKGKITYIGDIMSPIDVEWDAMK